MSPNNISDMCVRFIFVLSLARLYLAGLVEISLSEVDFWERILKGVSTCNIYYQKLRFFQKRYKIEYKLGACPILRPTSPLPGGVEPFIHAPIFQTFYKGK